jgi:hypothetical protein
MFKPRTELRTDCVRLMASMWGRMEMGIVRSRDGSGGGGSANESRNGPWQISHVLLPFSLIHRWMQASCAYCTQHGPFTGK